MSDTTIKKIALFALPKLQRYLDKFKNIFRRSDTMNAAERYTTGLLSDIPYKNCGMMAEYMEGTSSQSLQDFLTNSPWDYNQLNSQRVKHLLEYATSDDGALIFDDTGFAKKGNCSVGVARQYSGTLGKVGNCQIAVTCQYTDKKYTWPVNARLYLPESWTFCKQRMKKAKVPEDISFKTKPQIALELLDQANNKVSFIYPLSPIKVVCLYESTKFHTPLRSSIFAEVSWKKVSHILLTKTKPSFFRVDNEQFSNYTYGNYFTITHNRIVYITVILDVCWS